MIPQTSVPGVGHNDHRVVPDEAVLYSAHDQCSMVIAVHKISIARMLIVGADWLVESDCR